MTATAIFNDTDRKQLADRGTEEKQAIAQLEQFRKGFPYMEADRPCTAGDGIKVFTAEEAERYAGLYEQVVNELEVVKFVPASGAATRMFEGLHEDAAAKRFLDSLDKFAFGEDFPAGNIEGVAEYANLPKALLKFHRYEDGGRTVLEEHLAEAGSYAKGKGGKARLHFTLSPHHMEKVRAFVKALQGRYEKELNVRYEISYSRQEPATDAIAVNPDNTPFRDEGGRLVFRPGGHGALLQNLNGIDADIIFIKNIDNVQPDRLKEESILYKKALAGYLLELRRELSDDRPVRVCGMVRNEGEPGGGPFWVKGQESLQIVEKSQISDDDDQQRILASATHFNPVDLVCAVRNKKRRKYDLRQFTDPETGFISEKTITGKPVRAIELPGLWNGAMARWHTVFVQVPLSTFSPVKTVFDLLKPEHRT